MLKKLYAHKPAITKTRKKPVESAQDLIVIAAITPHLTATESPFSTVSQPLLHPRMKVFGLNHFNITASSALIEQIKRFYVDIIGLKVGPRARLEHEGYWLYADASSILHLSASQQIEESQLGARGYFNHISLNCTGLAETIERMEATGTPYRVVEILDINQTQIFLKDPAGIGVELTFLNEFL